MGEVDVVNGTFCFLSLFFVLFPLTTQCLGRLKLPILWHSTPKGDRILRSAQESKATIAGAQVRQFVPKTDFCGFFVWCFGACFVLCPVRDRQWSGARTGALALALAGFAAYMIAALRLQRGISASMPAAVCVWVCVCVCSARCFAVLWRSCQCRVDLRVGDCKRWSGRNDEQGRPVTGRRVCAWGIKCHNRSPL